LLLKHAVIEDASIELLELFDRVSKEARIEKNAVPPINKMTYWWTRKPLIVGRAMALASTLDNIEDVKSLLGLNTENRAYQYIPDNTLFAKKLGVDPKEIKVLDPFGGSGNLLFASTQFGLDTTCSDYNPLAYLISKGTLEYPGKYGKELISNYEKLAKDVIEKTKKDLGHFFQPNHLSYLWVWCIQCPHCDQRVPLTNQMLIGKFPEKNIGVRFDVTDDKNFKTTIIRNMTLEEGKQFTQKQGKATCISCKNSISNENITDGITTKKDREMIAIIIRKNNKREFISPNEEDTKMYLAAVKYFESQKKEFEKIDLIPTEPILPNHRKEMTLWHYGIKQWDQFFDKRQLLVLCTLMRNIQSTCSRIKDKKLASVMSLYLSFLLTKLVNHTGLGLVWNIAGKSLGPEHILILREPKLIFNHAEINPFEKVRGGLNNILGNITKGIKFSTNLSNFSNCKLSSVTNNSVQKYDLIITDPPYGDDVQYGELSEYFYVWIYRTLKDYFPELPPRIPLDEDFCESWGRFGDKKRAKEFFDKGLKTSFVSMNDKLKDDGLLVVFFAHSSTEAWNIFLDSIKDAKFRVVSSYSIHTENTSNIMAIGKTSFMSSIVVVCRKILQPSEAYFENLIPQIEDKIKNMLKQIPDEKLLALPITDLLIMVYGKVLEASTQHTTLKSYQKDFTPDFETLIKDARSFIIKELVGKITGKSLNVIGPRMAFYLLIKVFHKGIIGSDDAIKISKTYDVDIKDLEKDQVVIKDKNVIRLYYLNENEMDYSPDNVEKSNLYQQLCYIAYTADSRSLDKIPALLTLDNFRAEDLKQVISLLIKNYHLRRNKGESLNPKEQRELEILESLGDTVGVKVEGTMDSFL
jgi:putative DNA methylase